MRTSNKAGVELLAALLVLALPAAARAQPEPQPADSFADRVDVTAVELMIDVRDKRGRPVQGLGPEDFEVLEDGEPMVILGVDYPPPPRIPAAAGTPEAQAPAEVDTAPQERWRFLVYVDLPLTRKRSLRRAVKALDAQVDELVELGPVEVVTADPRPRMVLPFSSDPGRIREALGELAEGAGGHELVRIRRDFLRRMDMRWRRDEAGTGADTEVVVNLIRDAIGQEYLILRRRLLTLAQWIASYGHVPASAVILVSDGFDVSLTDFYVAATSRPAVEARLIQEFNRYRMEPELAVLAREIAAHGWTSVALALGGTPLDAADASLAFYDRFRAIGESSELIATGGSPPVSTLERPVEALKVVAAETGGEVLTTAKTAGAALGRIAGRMRLSYQASRPSDGRMHRVEVRLRRKGLKLLAPRQVRSPTPGQVAGARARRLLVSDLDAGDLPVRVVLGELGAGKARDSRRVEVETVFELDLLRPLLRAPAAPFSFTFGVAVAGAPPIIRRVTQKIALPGRDVTGVWPPFIYRVVLEVPAGVRRVSVVVEDPASGVWGGALAEPGD